MTVSASGSDITMEANGAGYNQYRFPLPEAPADADMMVFAFRYWYDTFAASEDANAGWDGSDCFGLSFDGVMPDDTAQANFFGWVDTDAGQNLIYSAANANFNNADVVLGDTSHDVLDGEGNNLGAINSDQARFLGGFGKPANPTVGATYTGLWIVKRDAGSADKIMLTQGANFQSLANLSLARTDSNTVFGETDTLLTVGNGGNWRSGGGINFPTWVVSKFTSASVGKKFVLDSYHTQYYKYCS